MKKWMMLLWLSGIFSMLASASPARPVVYFLPGVFDSTVVEMRIEAMRFMGVTMENLGKIDSEWQTTRLPQTDISDEIQGYLIETRTQWASPLHQTEMKNRLLGYLPVADYLVYLEMDQPDPNYRWIYVVIFPLRGSNTPIVLEREQYRVDDHLAENIDAAANRAAHKIYNKVQELTRTAFREENKRQVVFVVDESETMKTNDPDRIRADVIDFIIANVLHEFDEVGLVGFNSFKETRTILPLTPVETLRKRQKWPAQQIQNQRRGGKFTNLYAGLQQADQLFQATPPAACQVVILLSDGITRQQNGDSELDIAGLKRLKKVNGVELGRTEKEIHTAVYDQLLPRLLANFRERGVQLHTITFAKESGRGFTYMEELDRLPDGINDALILTTRFDSLYAEILTQTLNPQRCRPGVHSQYQYESIQLQRGKNYIKYLDVSRDPADLRTDVFFSEKVDFSDGKPEVILYTPDNRIYHKTSAGLGKRSSISFFVPQDSIAKYAAVPGRWRIEITQVDVNVGAVVGFEWLSRRSAPLLLSAWIDPETNEWFFETNDVQAMMQIVQDFLNSPQFQNWTGKMTVRGTETTIQAGGIEDTQAVEITVEKETPESEPVITRTIPAESPPKKFPWWWVILGIVLVTGVATGAYFRWRKRTY